MYIDELSSLTFRFFADIVENVASISSKEALFRLTALQAAWAMRYAETLEPTKSAIEAGYSAKHADIQGAKNKRSHKCMAAVSALINESIEARKPIIRKKVIDTLEDIASTNVTDDIKIVTEEIEVPIYQDGKPTGQTEIKTAQVVRFSDTEDMKHGNAISEIGYDSNGRIKIKYHDKTAAAKVLGEFADILTDKVEISGPNGGPIEIRTRKERQGRISDLLARRAKNAKK